MGWYNSNWQYRIKITVDHTKVNANLTDFPVYLDLSDLPADFFSNVKSDGSDIRITKADGTTELPREVVSINTSAQTGELHFKADSLSSSVDTDFYIYYGNSSASEPAVTATYGRNAVWDGCWRVYHFDDTTDSSGNQDATNHGGSLITGGVGKAQDFASADSDWWEFGAVDVQADYSLEFYAYIDVNSTDNRLLGVATNPGDHDVHTIGQYNSDGSMRLWDGDTWVNWGQKAASGSWRHFGYFIDSTDHLTTFVDGVVGLNGYLLGHHATYGLNVSGMGAFRNYMNTYGTYTDGKIAEFRVWKQAKTKEWFQTSNNNLSSPSTFYTTGSQETNSPSDWYNSSWGYRVKITVDHTKVDANLTDFPVYVDLSNLPSNFFTHVKSDGGDIRITKSDGITELPREVVSIDTSTQTGELHFKADSLSSTTDTDFYVYYGNSSASEPAVTDTYGRNNVWTKYEGVWHLQEAVNNSTDGYVDSTGNGHDGTGHSMSITAPDGALAGKGQQFDGSQDYIEIGDEIDLGTNDATITAWTYHDSSQTSQATVVSKSYYGPGNYRYAMFVKTSKHRGFMHGDSNGDKVAIATTNVDDAWHYGAVVYDRDDLMRIYTNGVQEASTSISLWNGSNFNSGYPLRIGIYGSTNKLPFKGKLDEIRIALHDLGTDWLKTDYNNQNSPSTFYSVGSEETPSSGGSQIKVWNGSAWVLKPLKRWNGTAWVDTLLKRWNGSSWETV